MKYLGFIGAVVLIISSIIIPEVFGTMRQDYSPVSNYLSELGALGADYAWLVSVFGFLVTGIVVGLLLVLLMFKLPSNAFVRIGFALCAGVSVGYLGAYIFPCDAGCPVDGSTRQDMHNLAGLIEYIGAITGLLCLNIGLQPRGSYVLRMTTLAAVICMTLGFVLMTIPDMQSVRGLSQRLADYSFFLWLAFTVLAPNAILIRTHQ